MGYEDSHSSDYSAYSSDSSHHSSGGHSYEHVHYDHVKPYKPVRSYHADYDPHAEPIIVEHEPVHYAADPVTPAPGYEGRARGHYDGDDTDIEINIYNGVGGSSVLGLGGCCQLQRLPEKHLAHTLLAKQRWTVSDR